MTSPPSLAILAVWLLVILGQPGPARARELDDSFLAGYVTATLERELGVQDALQGVRRGVVSLDRGRVSSEDRPRVEAALDTIEGIVELRWTGSEAATPQVEAAGREGIVFLPPQALFEPLLADPRWPHFSAAYQRYHEGPGLDRVGSVSFGAAVPIVQGELRSKTRWELGLHTAVFSIFDLATDSLDLINTDFWVGLPISVRRGRFSTFARLYHQSSHLGDEFLLRGPVDRVNLSYEAVDGVVSYETDNWVRIYGGGGVLIHREPGNLERLSLQLGLELTSPRAFLNGAVRPVAGIDLHRREEYDWDTDYSVRAGFQLENPRIFGGRRLQLLGEYYKGHSPNGQFFESKIEFVGVGLHLHY